MADAPWRCSQCGTINEPVANACRTCGRWPSLFDLEESKIEDVPASATFEDESEMVELESQAPEPEPAPEPEQQVAPEVIADAPVEEEARSRRRRRQQLVRFAIPVGIALYILISSIANR